MNLSRNLKIFTTSILICLIASCSSINNVPLKPQVQVMIEEPNRIRFSGKGAGAGMMLMSSMGATGIAIGVAIDEGIGKTIEETAIAHNIDFSALIKADFLAKLSNLNQKISTPINEAKLEIKRYGFIVKGGENDPTTVEYIIRYQLGDNKEWQSFHFPTQKNETLTLLTKSLEQVKEDEQAIRLLIIDGLKHFTL